MIRRKAVRLAVLSTVFMVLTEVAHAQVPADATTLGPVAVLKEAAKDLAGLASTDTLRILAIGGGAAAAVHPADRNLNQQFDGSDYRFLAPGRVLGHATLQGGAAVATYVWSRAVGSEGKLASIGQELVRAQLVTQVSTLAVKITVRRDRPDGSNSRSFPSGHASTTFATATIIDGHFGWRVAVPSYVLATYVATSRLHENRHNASDVLFGAALGIASGRVTLRREKSRVVIQPVPMTGGAGVIVLW